MEGYTMAVTNLAQLCSEYMKAVNAGDLDAICEMYAADAVFVPGPGAEGVAGRAAIREILSGFLATRPVMEFEHTYMFQRGDTALARGKWKLTGTGADGTGTVVTGSSIEVLRRDADGRWRYVIDHPWGGDSR
jgi:uncharacterized protein (TIGR02246 family)